MIPAYRTTWAYTGLVNYYEPRQLADKSGWHMTCRNDDRIWGVGYDSNTRTCPDCHGRSWMVVDHDPGEPNYCATCESKGYVEVEPHPPHATKEEAYACATQYVLDTAKFDQRFDTTHSVPRCEYPLCEVLVEDGGMATYGFGIGSTTVLCEAHRNRESLSVVIGPSVGDCISS